MYTLQLSVWQVMDLWHVTGAVVETAPGEPSALVASFSHDFQLSDAWLDQDQTATIVEVVRQWAEMTSRS